MKLIVLLFVIKMCYCKVEFSDRPRNFSIELLYYTQLQTDNHIVISPFGIWTLLTGLMLGATGNSYEQIRRAFILPRNNEKVIDGYKNLTQIVLNPTTADVTLTSNNFMFPDKGLSIHQKFGNIMRQEFGAVIKELNFYDPNTAARIANDYIQNSSSSVSNVLTPDDFADSKMILTNVIKFRGLWSSPFDESDTTIMAFYNEDREAIGSVNMMYQKAQLPLSDVNALKATVLELPYGSDGKYSMLLFLPYLKTKVADMYRNFARFGLKDVMKLLDNDFHQYGIEEVDVSIPRFKISTNIVLNKPLNDMGVYDIFEPLYASFKKISSDEIYVSAIIHKADIEVTESGTVASAATSALLNWKLARPSFVANRPFVYFIMEKSTTTALFGGIYSKPTLY